MTIARGGFFPRLAILATVAAWTMMGQGAAAPGRANHEGRTLPAMPKIDKPILFNTPGWASGGTGWNAPPGEQMDLTRKRFANLRTKAMNVQPAFDENHHHAGPVADWSGKVEEPALQTELRAVLTTAINDLPTDYRTAFLMHDVEGLSNSEIAETLHRSLPAVKSRVHRSRLFLRERLSRYMAAA
jgi:RNA polymerase sigma factor (sigma-70 family)